MPYEMLSKPNNQTPYCTIETEASYQKDRSHLIPRQWRDVLIACARGNRRTHVVSFAAPLTLGPRGLAGQFLKASAFGFWQHYHCDNKPEQTDNRGRKLSGKQTAPCREDQK
jgi:hypothetical protein